MTRAARLGKVLLYSHDSYGLGHLRRNLAVARHLLGERHPPQVVLASGSPVLDRVDRPERLVCAQLPPVTKIGPEEYRPLEANVSMSLVKQARSAVLRDVVLRWRPDVLLVDHAPHGLKGELLPVFETIESRMLATKVVLGLRDILDEPARVRATWVDQGVYETLAAVYDQVVVYGERDLFDVVDAYGIPEPLASRVEFCGYVTSEQATPDRAADPAGYVLGTVGGGGDGVDVLVATLEAARRAGSPAVLCTGPLMSRADRLTLDRAVARFGSALGVSVLEHVQDLPSLARGARCVVTRGGYNTLCELLAVSVPVVVVPRVWPRREQLLRARAFAGRGLVHVVDPRRGDLGERVAAAVVRASAGGAGTSTGGAGTSAGGGGTSAGGGRPRRPLDLGGARRVVEVLARTFADGCDAGAPLGSRIPA